MVRNHYGWDIARLRSAAPAGLKSICYLTQHSACGCVLGYTESPPRG
jgi:hypothetical protein